MLFDFHNWAAKDEFLRVQGYAIPTAHVKPLHGLVEAVGDIIRPEQGVVDTFRMVVYPRDNLVVSASVAIARCAITLWSDTVAVTSPWRDERRQVFIVLVQTHAVIPVPSVEHRLTLVLGDTSRLMERGWVWWVSRAAYTFNA